MARSDHVAKDVSLAAYTTLKVGGPAQEFVDADTSEEVIDAVMHTDQPVLILAGGSNLLITDHGFDGRVVHIASRGVQMAEDQDSVVVDVQAGHPWDELVAETVAAGLSGFECLSGIPGSTGATPVQNVGAYGEDIAAVTDSVSALDRESGEVVDIGAEDCGFGYRTSRFKHRDRFVILSVRFRLARSALSAPLRYGELARRLDVAPGDRAPLAETRQAVIALRKGKGMVLDAADPDTNSAGSFFTNPVLTPEEFRALEQAAGADTPPSWLEADGSVKTSAAWLIERAGFTRGYGTGPARLSSKHSLAITNRGDATAEDIAVLARELRDGVRARFGVTLHPEPVWVGQSI